MTDLNYRLVQLSDSIEVPYLGIDGNNEFTSVFSYHQKGSLATVINGKLRFAIGDEIDINQLYPNQFDLVNDGRRSRPIYPESENAFETTPNFKLFPVLRGFEQIQDVFNAITPLGGFIGGGWATWMSVPESVSSKSGFVKSTSPVRPKDADIFCLTKDTYKSIHSVLVDTLGFIVVASNDIVNTYAPSRRIARKGCPTIQLVAPLKLGNGTTFGHFEEVADSFDFSVCRSVLVSPTNVLADVDMAADYAAKRIVLRTAHCAIGNAMRISKYVAKGFTADPYQYLIMAHFASESTDRLERLRDFAKRVSETIAYESWTEDRYANRLTTEEKGLMYQMLYIA